MRRFIAYLSLAFAGLVTVGATFNMAFTKTHTNMDFANGKELVFRLNDAEKEITEEDQNEIVELMEDRLNKYGCSKFEVVTEGTDTIKVNVSETFEDNYKQIATYLTFDGEFAIGTKDDAMALGDQFMDKDRQAYIDYVNQVPTIVLPVNKEDKDWQHVVDAANKLAEDSKPAEGSEEEAPATYLYLIYNYEPDLLISNVVNFDGNESYDETKKDKLLMQFDISYLWRNDEHEEIATMVNLDTDGDGKISTVDVERGNNLAKYFVNLLNSSPLPVDVNFIYSNPIEPLQENIIALGTHQTAAWSKTLVATVFAIIILALLLGVFFRYAAIAIGVTSILSTYTAMLLSILFRVEFNVGAIVGLCAVAIASLVCGVIYLNKVKEECYHGRTLKKANAEGAKKSLLPIVDINVVLIIIGAMTFLLGGTALTGLSSMFIFGGLTSLVLNVFLLRIFMWLLTNTTKFNGKYDVIGVEKDKVPNLINEEAQTYYGPFQDKDFTKKKKLSAIIFSVLAVASIAGAATFGAINNGEMFNSGNYRNENTYLYVETKNATSDIDQEYVSDFLDKTTLGEGKVALKDAYSIKDYKYLQESYDENNKDPYEVALVVVTFKNNINPEEKAYVTTTVEGSDPTEKEYASLNALFEEYFDTQIDRDVTYSLKVGKLVNKQQPDTNWIMVATAVSLAVGVVYLSLRYGLSRGAATLVITALSTIIPLGFFSLTRIAVLNDLLIALPVSLFIAFVASIIFMDKDKDMYKEDYIRNKDNTSDHRHELSLKANALAAGPLCVAMALILFLAINFFGIGTLQMSNLFILVILGCIVGTISLITLFVPISSAIYAWIRRFNLPTINFKHKKKKVTHHVKSGEPEEAIFIGMND